MIHLWHLILWNVHNPGRICTIVNDRLRRKAEIYGDHTQVSYTGTVYGMKRWETDSVYGDRIKIRSDSKVKFSTPYTELYDCRIRSYTVTICVTFQIRTENEWVYNSKCFFIYFFHFRSFRSNSSTNSKFFFIYFR